MKRIGIILGAAVIGIAGCASSSGGGGTNDSSLACNHFRNVAGDISNGILSDSEIRDKAKQINSDAAIATQDVQTAATELLAAATTGTTADFLTAAGDLDTACKAAGD